MTKCLIYVEKRIKLSFRVFSQEDLPGVDRLGNPVTEVSVYSQIRVPVRPIFSELFSMVTLLVAITTDIPKDMF